MFPAENKAGHLLYQAKSVRKIKAELSFKFYLHLCRHTFITYAISKLKIHGYLVKKLVNHISGMSGDVTFDYMGVDDESLREVVLKIEDFLLKNGTNCEKEASQI